MLVEHIAARRSLLGAPAPAAQQIIKQLIKDATPGVNVGSSQGVATDGTWFWTSGNDANQRQIRIFNAAWAEQTGAGSPHSTNLDFASHAQVNGLICDRANNKLYAGANNFPTTPAQGWVLEYDVNPATGALTFVAARGAGAIWCEGCARGPDGKWWVHHHGGASIRRYNADWSFDQELTPLLTPVKSNGYYQGGRFIDGLFYLNTHGNSGGGLDAYHWDSVQDRLSWTLVSLAVPTDCTQGIDLDGSALYMAERTGNDHATPNNVVRASYTQAPLPPLLIGKGAAQNEQAVNSLTMPAFAPPAGNNRCAIVFASWEQNAPAGPQSVASLTWGAGNSGTEIGTWFNPGNTVVHNGLTAYRFMDANFPASAQDLTITLAQNTQVDGNDLHLAIAVFEGVNQSTPIEALIAENDLSIDVTTLGVGRMLINLITNGNSGTSPGNGQITVEDATLSEFVSRMSAKAALDAGSYTLGWIDADSVRPINVGFALLPA